MNKLMIAEGQGGGVGVKEEKWNNLNNNETKSIPFLTSFEERERDRESKRE